mgnify:CR=1 FL=1
MTKKNDAQINFALTAIKTEQFAIFEENFEQKNESGFSTELQFKLNHINKQIGVFLGFEFFQNEKIFLKIQVSCNFKIQEQSWDNFIHENKSDIVIPKNFMAHLEIYSSNNKCIRHDSRRRSF